MEIRLRALPKKNSKKILKYTVADFVQNCPRISKIYLARLSDVSRNENYFLKLTKGSLKSHIGALELSGSTQSVTFNFLPRFFARRLIDEPDTFLKSLDNS